MNISVKTVSDHLRPENTVITKELVRKLKINSLEPVLFERLDFIKLSCLKYLVTSFIDFSVCRKSFTSLLVYCQLLL